MAEPDDGAEPVNRWKTLDRDLRRVGRLEVAAAQIGRPLIAGAIALIFLALSGVGAAVMGGGDAQLAVIVAAAALAGYMALNVGANDIGNTIGPAVGARAIPLGAALLAAAVAEAAGALIAGGQVAQTISSGIAAGEYFADSRALIGAMMAALIAAALWINVATLLSAPVSTTHAIVGAVAGSSMMAAGMGAVDWSRLLIIAMGWVISPLAGGSLAAALLAVVSGLISDREDKIGAARVWIPVLTGVMAAAFAIYVIFVEVPLVDSGWNALFIATALGVLVWVWMRGFVDRRALGLENRRRSIRPLFAPPLVAASLLLCFAHGANDVANSVGPLLAIVDAYQSEDMAAPPFWVMLIGAAGLALGLSLFGTRLIRLVGSEITRLNPTHAWCIALSTAVTTLLASLMGLPVSSTHISIGGVFGVGFYREWRSARKPPKGDGPKTAPVEEQARRRLVRRSHVATILGAWIVTVPLCAGFSATIYALLRVFFWI